MYLRGGCRGRGREEGGAEQVVEKVGSERGFWKEGEKTEGVLGFMVFEACVSLYHLF